MTAGRGRPSAVAPADALRREARRLYGDRGDGVAQELIDLARRFEPPPGRRPVPPAERMGAGDAVAIAYADMVRRPGEPPLRTLARLLRGPLAGAVSTVHLLPFYPWSSDDGFAVTDYRAVAPAYGAWEDVHDLARDHRLMVDAVVNHASARGAWFAGFLRDEAPYRSWFRTEDPHRDLSDVVRPRTTPLLTPFDTVAGRRWAWTTFGPDQVDLDYREPSLLIEMAAVLLDYVGHGAEVLRMDAVPYLWKEPGTASIHHENTHALLRLLRALLELAAPWTVLLTETNVPHRENVAYFGDGANEAQMVYNFALPPLLAHAVTTGDVAPLRAWAAELCTPSDRTWFLNFLASHDGIGLRPAEGVLPPEAIDALAERTRRAGGRIGRKRDPGGGESPYELNVNLLDLLSPPDAPEPQGRGVARFLAAHAAMLALPGVPALYLHSLLGSRGAPERVERTGVARAINRAKLDEGALLRELAEPDGRRRRILDGLLRLLRARRGPAGFAPGAPAEVLDAPPGVLALRRGEGDARIVCLHELAGRPARAFLDEGGVDLLSDARIAAGSVPLAPYEVRWLRH